MASQFGTRETSTGWRPGLAGRSLSDLTTSGKSGVDSHGHVDTRVNGHRNPDRAGLHSKPDKSCSGKGGCQHSDCDVKGISAPILVRGACLIETGSHMPQPKEKGTPDQGDRRWVKGN